MNKVHEDFVRLHRLILAERSSLIQTFRATTSLCPNKHPNLREVLPGIKKMRRRGCFKIHGLALFVDFPSSSIFIFNFEAEIEEGDG